MYVCAVDSDLVIAVECVFSRYWIADFCAGREMPFVLGHALYMKAIHGAKTKNDKIGTRKIALLLRAGMIPQGYVYAAPMRSTRDLLRRREYFMYQQSALLAHIQNIDWVPSGLTARPRRASAVPVKKKFDTA